MKIKEEAQSESKDNTSMHLVNFFLSGINDENENLKNAFRLLGLGYRNKYEITEDKDLTTALEICLYDKKYRSFEIIYKHNCIDGNIIMVHRVIMRNF